MLMTAHHQWMTRPDDERFTSLDAMLAAMKHNRSISHESVEASRSIKALPLNSVASEADPRALAIVIDDKDVVAPTNWAFGQLASLVGAPAKYLRTLPADLAADNLNWGTHARDVSSVGVLKRINGTRELVAATGPDYGRVWNSDIVAALRERFGDGVSGEFTVPGEYGKTLSSVTSANTTLFASDRDMFVFLADEKNRIEVPDRRNGQAGTMARGFFVSNSEVGNSSLMVSTFLFDYVCANRIVWGPREYQEIRVRHSKGAPLRWLDEVQPAIEAYAHSSTGSIEDALRKAKAARIEGDGLDTFLAQRFNRNQVSAIKAIHFAEEDRPIESLWDVTTAITAAARSIKHQDARVTMEREAGKILDIAARQVA